MHNPVAVRRGKRLAIMASNLPPCRVIPRCIILENIQYISAILEVTRMTNQDQPAGRRPSKLAAALQNAVTGVHSFLYRASNGMIGGRLANSPVLLLTT